MKLSDQAGWNQNKIQKETTPNSKINELLAALVEEVETLKYRVDNLEKKNE